MRLPHANRLKLERGQDDQPYHFDAREVHRRSGVEDVPSGSRGEARRRFLHGCRGQWMNLWEVDEELRRHFRHNPSAFVAIMHHELFRSR